MFYKNICDRRFLNSSNKQFKEPLWTFHPKSGVFNFLERLPFLQCQESSRPLPLILSCDEIFKNAKIIIWIIFLSFFAYWITKNLKLMWGLFYFYQFQYIGFILDRAHLRSISTSSWQSYFVFINVRVLKPDLQRNVEENGIRIRNAWVATFGNR